ncbi:hypothetical protein Tsubulata_013060 [Turnera subulata]|uniref:Uncharacterized protein n=1 Tax=Turnera subulata TaxID=218843 RepID=A0A9Q0J1F7_9ROSI|nr:hypothetical protein Tsubulata_013060 [Turnera subulata]
MAEETAIETTVASEEMDLVDDKEANGEKRAREEEGGEENDDGASKKPKVEKSAEEERLEKAQGEDGDGDGEEEVPGPAELGPKKFGSSVEMFDYFYSFLHFWPPNLNINKYEHRVLLELLKKGHADPDRKIGSGVQAFQVRFHPTFKSRCFFVVRDDGSVDDFSFRKCVDSILPLPEDMKVKPDAHKSLGGRGHGGRGRGGGGRGRGRGFKSRN